MPKEILFDPRKTNLRSSISIKGITRVDIEPRIEPRVVQILSSNPDFSFFDRRRNTDSQLAYMTFKRRDHSIILDNVKDIGPPEFVLGNLRPPEGWRIMWSNIDAGIWIARQR